MDINQIMRNQQKQIDQNVTAFGSRHFRRDNRPKVMPTKEEVDYKKQVMAKQNKNYDNFFTKRAKITASIMAPTSIANFKSTESKILHGAADLEELNEKESKKVPIVPVKQAAAMDEDSDDCLEFEDAGGPASNGKPAAAQQSFKDFLAKRKIGFSERFGKGAAISGASMDLMKRRKTMAD